MAKQTGPSGADVVSAARSFLGIPYLYGGTNPAVGLDCSGLVLNVCKKAGINNCPRTSEQQFQWATPTSSPAPGDLVFFVGDPIDPPPGHVGIIVSPGRMIDAPFAGTTVRYDNYGSNGVGVNAFMGYRKIPGSNVSASANANVTAPGSGPGAGQNQSREASLFGSLFGGILSFVIILGLIALAIGALILTGIFITGKMT